MRKFRSGQVVCLPSNLDRPMTVEGWVGNLCSFSCVWLDDAGVQRSAIFHEDALVKYNGGGHRQATGGGNES